MPKKAAARGASPRDPDRVVVFDTTLRDGEQCPGASMNAEEKMTVARQLARLGVDVIEAGFPISSPGDFESVERIAEEVGTAAGAPVICGLARAVPADVEKAGKAVRAARRGRIHTFIATSPIHMERKLKKTPAQVLKAAVEAVRLARSFTEDVEWSAEDAGRSDIGFLCEIVEAAIEAGATTINIPDTVGYQTPFEFGEILRALRERVPNAGRAVFSVHCHDDLGLAVANSLAGVRNGARQIECTINGIGERAGNCSLEEVVMALEVRKDTFGVKTGIRTEEIYKASRLVSSLTGFPVPPNKAIVGANAFAHEAGIHQDGVLKHAQTYEIMRPEQVGVPRSELVLGKHSGRHAFVRRLKDLGFDLADAQVQSAFERFKGLADRKKVVYDEDLEAIVETEVRAPEEVYRLEALQVTSGTTVPTATVRLVKDGAAVQEAAVGDGPVDATYNAIDRITGIPCALADYQIRSVTKGQDALGEATVVVVVGGRRVSGRAASTDVIEASARAYLNAINRHLRGAGRARGAGEPPKGP